MAVLAPTPRPRVVIARTANAGALPRSRVAWETSRQRSLSMRAHCRASSQARQQSGDPSRGESRGETRAREFVRVACVKSRVVAVLVYTHRWLGIAFAVLFA